MYNMAKQAVMKVWDVQLGLAIHIKAPNGKYLVIDLGTGNWESGNTSPLSMLNNEDIHYMIITHPHLDHIDDILHFEDNEPTVLWRATAITNDEVMEDVRECDKPKFEKYCEINDRFTGAISSNNDPSTEIPFDGMTVDKYFTTLCDKSNFNNFSPVTIVRLDKIKIVICGDNESASFEKLIKQTGFGDDVSDADILVAAHHGRETGYYKDFVDKVNPRLTIISDSSKSSTTAQIKYTNVSRGWDVHNLKSGNDEKRYCLTTRRDGNIKILFGESSTSNNGVLSVSIHA
jgi:competence protein ComEC